MISPLGQMIMTGVEGTSLSEKEKVFIEKENIGGVVLFSRNFENPAQLAELVNSIQVLRSEYPLFIAVDHEGGRVLRFKEHFSQFPSMMEISKLNSPKLIYKVHQIMAEELSACGINVNLSPVCDILTNPSNKVIGDRAFGEDADSVSKFISSAIRGLQTGNIIACAKHFPGHGGTTKDSHHDLPYVKTAMEDLKNKELIPFIKAIKSRVEFFMMGHLVVDAFDTERPCSLSEKAHQYVREELRYNRIIISDDMQMGAITDHFGMEEAAIMALNAGTDIIEYRDIENAMVAMEAVHKAKKDKDLSSDSVNRKLERINECKKRYLAEYSPVYIPKLTKTFSSKSNEIFLTEIQDRITEQMAQV